MLHNSENCRTFVLSNKERIDKVKPWHLKQGKRKTQKPYETSDFIKDLESQNKIRSRNLTTKGRGKPLPPLGFSYANV